MEDGISVRKNGSWIGPLAPLVKSGESKHIEYFSLNEENCDKLVRELQKDEVGYAVITPWAMDAISSAFDLRFFKSAKTAMWIPQGGYVDAKIVEAFASFAIPVRSTYSSEEVGSIGNECSKFSGYYHVATSNVLVEIVDRRFELDGVKVGRLLVTHLHSYATPFIRYDLGDLACLDGKCPCGHNGPAIYNLQGRASSVIKHRDGRLSPFFISGKHLAGRADFTEYRMRQTAFDKIVIELGGRSELKPDEVAGLTTFLKEIAGLEFDIEVKACRAIDWGESRKRAGFRCEI